ncbi:MAG: stage II sporulation protein R [Oscillospiraceae bacterium]|nr:stage II sporulation protein R [Oscillospiraceae bacterium]
MKRKTGRGAGFRGWEIALALGLLVSLAAAYRAEAAASRLADGIVRLHITAEGDGPEQQALKLAVRDAVQAVTRPALEGVSGRDRAESRLRALLPEIEAAAREAAVQGGRETPVTAALDWEDFPTREYDTFALPAGRYLSLRVSLGSGQGQNWWCVVFPPLCDAASAEELAETDALSGGDRRFITRDGVRYVIRFKLAEIWEKLRRR